MAIGDLKERLRAKFTRRLSSTSTTGSGGGEVDEGEEKEKEKKDKKSRSLRSRGSVRPSSSSLAGEKVDEEDEEEGEEEEGEGIHREVGNINVLGGGGGIGVGRSMAARDIETPPDPGDELERKASSTPQQHQQPAPSKTTASTTTTTISTTTTTTNDHSLLEVSNRLALHEFKHDSSSTADFPTPNTDISPVPEEEEEEEESEEEGEHHVDHDAASAIQQDIDIQLTQPSNGSETAPAASPRPSGPPRRQSLLPYQQTKLIKTLLETDLPPPTHVSDAGYFASHGPATISANMVSRKIWVKRPGASPTLVTIHEDDLVDDVRDMILKKYANSLGRSFDAPDVALRIVPKENRLERTLGPEEPMSRTLDSYFPGGQTVDDALVIDVPLRKTPRPSPQPMRGYYDQEGRPAEAGSDYFPPMPVQAIPSPHLAQALPVNGSSHHSSLTTHSMSVLATGHIPSLPSPGSTRRHHRDGRPRATRQHTSSPTILNGQHSSSQIPSVTSGTQFYPPSRVPRSRTHSSASETSVAPPIAPPLPTPPAAGQQEIQRVATPPPRVSSPRPQRQRKTKKASAVDHPTLPMGMLNGAVPPINVLIVEDNIINLKLLEAFMKRLKVRWQTAMNGRDAVLKWRAGGFHLVLMDIQLPIMSGLEATKEIRRLERLNSIGVFSSSAGSKAPKNEGAEEPDEKDRLPSTVLFKSPVIIVALTASSLQSDRHEALAAGCNDFLTKPVNFVWLERKVMEWGCMQALIDFDGWRKWKDFSQNRNKDDEGKGGDGGGEGTGKKADKKKKNRMSLGSVASGGSQIGGAGRVPIVGEV